jgi:excisionase family DNA binding protein
VKPIQPLTSCKAEGGALLPNEQEQHFDVFEALSAHKGCLTVPELANMLGVSKNGLYEQVKAGTLPALRIGTTVRLNPRTIASWLRERTTAKRYR